MGKFEGPICLPSRDGRRVRIFTINIKDFIKYHRKSLLSSSQKVAYDAH